LKNVILAAVAIALVACGPSKTTEPAAGTETTATHAPETASTPPATATKAEEEKPMSYYENKVAELHTSAGEIDIRFSPDVAPNHVKNFIDLAEKGFYNGTKFHRVIPGFMIQGGDPNTISGDPSTWGTGGNPGKYVQAEFNNTHHKRGIVSMARANDPNSASSQFFICVADAGFLDGKYTAFGEVTKGMDVADKIVNGARDTSNDRPKNPVTIDKVVIREAKADEKAK
jgi:peptidyl-prolyl cis-trans isomerase B (cyclophilin B)